MALIDLHVHSIYSEHPSEWFLQRIGAGESYTKPSTIFQKALESGMTFVTITDHNSISGSLMLKSQYPNEVITGVEATAYFPEDGCKVHILIYGLTQVQFEIIQQKRKNIYHLRDYLVRENLAHSVAHATYSVNNKITLSHLERLLLLFDNFEVINGGRTKKSNELWLNTLSNLNVKTMDSLYKKYDIEPMSNDPWIKGYTAGSDDHAGLLIGKTYTFADVKSTSELLDAIRNKKTIEGGRHNNYKSLAFTVYKIAIDFSKQKQGSLPNLLLNNFSEYLFSNKSSGFAENLRLKYYLNKNNRKKSLVKKYMYDLLESLKSKNEGPVDDRFDTIYGKLSDVLDELLKNILNSVNNSFKKFDYDDIFKSLTAVLPGVFLSLPFFTTLKHMYHNRELRNQIQEKYLNGKSHNKEKAILWFTDTLNDLNGVSVTVKQLGWTAFRFKKNLKIVSILEKNEITQEIPPNYINLSSIMDFSLPHYESYKVRIPSIMKSISVLVDLDPDEIVISTPGPIGMLGLFLGYLLNIKVTGIYHTDFRNQYEQINDDDSSGKMIEDMSNWFYSRCDVISVPTFEYMDLLEKRGLERHKMVLFRRGLDNDVFKPVKVYKHVNKTWKFAKGFNMLFVGRISKDKNLDFPTDLHKELCKKYEKVTLILAGNGPYLDAMKAKTNNDSSVVYLGKVDKYQLAELYTWSDVFVFPSITDTFGMVILEAQACGLPCIVSNMGGPKEIIIDGTTGYVANPGNFEEWVSRVSYYFELKQNKHAQYQRIREECHKHASYDSDWKRTLNDFFQDHPKEDQYNMNPSPKKEIPAW